MPLMPAARPSRPSTKFTAFISTSTRNTDSTMDSVGSTATMPMPGITSQLIWIPFTTITEAAKIWPANLVSGSSSNLSSTMPSSTTRKPPHSSAWMVLDSP